MRGNLIEVCLEVDRLRERLEKVEGEAASQAESLDVWAESHQRLLEENERLKAEIAMYKARLREQAKGEHGYYVITSGPILCTQV